MTGDAHSGNDRPCEEIVLREGFFIAFVFSQCHPRQGKGVQVMLVLSRKVNEEIVIGNCITLKVVKVTGNKVRLGISAPRSVNIRRREMTPPPADLIELPLDEFVFDAAETTVR
jgi:carbon storage regulator CsrA